MRQFHTFIPGLKNSFFLLLLSVLLAFGCAHTAHATAYFNLAEAMASANERSAPEPLVTIGPNPFTDNFRIQLSAQLAGQQVEVRIMNVIGRVVFSYQGPASQLDAALAAQSSRWPKGYYYLMLKAPATGGSQLVRLQKL